MNLMRSALGGQLGRPGNHIFRNQKNSAPCWTPYLSCGEDVAPCVITGNDGRRGTFTIQTIGCLIKDSQEGLDANWRQYKIHSARELECYIAERMRRISPLRTSITRARP